MLEDDALDETLDELTLLGIEAREGLEVEAEILVRPALIVLEEERIGGDGEGDGQLAEDLEGG